MVWGHVKQRLRKATAEMLPGVGIWKIFFFFSSYHEIQPHHEPWFPPKIFTPHLIRIDLSPQPHSTWTFLKDLIRVIGPEQH